MTKLMTFKAPWATSLSIMTFIGIAILLGCAVIGINTGPNDNATWILSMTGFPVAIIVGTMFFMVRGYQIESNELIIQRLGWVTRIDLTQLISVEHNPKAMERSIRTFGNGGLFCFSGSFRNKQLGSYRAYATDPGQSVVLTFPDKKIVVTPDRVEEFVVGIDKRLA
jgi:hypothetical protein